MRYARGWRSASRPELSAMKRLCWTAFPTTPAWEPNIALTDLADGEVIDTTAFCLIVNALLIARYGCVALEIQQKERR